MSTQLESAPGIDRFYDVGGLRIHTVEWGAVAAPQCLVLLHGIGGNAMTWNAVAPRIQAAEPGRYRLIALDQRGSGISDQPESGYDIDAFADDVEQICSLEGLDQVALVGHSRGGWLAAYLAGKRPDIVRRLVLIDPARIGYESVADADEFYGRIRDSLGPFPTLAAAIAH